jgi:uncharacterized protein YggE
VRADEYVVVFGITREGSTLADCNKKMESTVQEFATSLKALGISDDDIYVDFVAQNRIYGYEIADKIAREKVIGYELKKNVSVHYQKAALLDKVSLAAAQAQVFDLIKVDYHVSDVTSVRNRVMDEAARVIKQKVTRYEKLFSIKFQPQVQVYAERPGVHYPSQMYDSYTAFESEDINVPNPQRYTVIGARKNKTFFFNPLNGSDFDIVVNPVIIEPVVQFTLYLKIKYDVEQPKTKLVVPGIN